MKYNNILKIINENTSAGATCAGNIAVAVNPLSQSVISRSIGVGFDPDGNWGVYEPAKKDKQKKDKEDKDGF